jgi:cytosine deaminase
MVYAMFDSAAGSATLLNATLIDGQRADVRVVAGRITAIERAVAERAVAERAVAEHAESDPSAPAAIDLGGRLLLPSLIDGHAHPDKTFLGAPWQPHQPIRSLAEHVARERRVRATLATPVTERAAALLERMIAFGTGHVRAHVDVDPDGGLGPLDALLGLRERYADRISVQIVAFPQSGIVASPGVADLLAAALRQGADVVGGLDPASFDGDADAHLDVMFALAERFGRPVDIHLHDTGAAGRAQLAEIARRTAALGMAGQVVVSHASALAGDEADVRPTRDALAEAGVAVAVAPTTRPLPDIERLRAAGVRVFAGSDNIRDSWWPFGTGDLLESAGALAQASGFRRDEQLVAALDLVTSSAAAALGLTDHGLTVGARADLVALDAHGAAEAVAAHPSRLLVLHGGRVVAGSPRLGATAAPARRPDARRFLNQHFQEDPSGSTLA